MSCGQRLSQSCRSPNAKSGDGTGASQAQAASRWLRDGYSRASCTYCGRVANGRRCRKSDLAVRVLSTNTSDFGRLRAYSCVCGERGLRNTTSWRGSPGVGRAWMAAWSKRRWPRKPWDQIRPIGEKKGSKRSLLVDERGTPLSIVASGAHVHDVKLLEPTLDQTVATRPPPQNPPRENLCLDAGYAGEPARKAVEARHYVPHVRPRNKEIAAKRRRPCMRTRRWVVERTHSWLNRYRKLLVRFEKTALSFEGLLQLACSLIVFRRVITIYG